MQLNKALSTATEKKCIFAAPRRAGTILAGLGLLRHGAELGDLGDLGAPGAPDLGDLVDEVSRVLGGVY